ncbi:MAG TPA: acyl carrier protein [Acidimicrobiales bacterium]
MTSISGTTETATTQTGTNGDTPTAGTDEIAKQVRAFLVDTFLLGDDDGFADDESLLDSGIVDSTGVMEVVAFLEETFGIEIDDDELIADNLDSVRRLAAFVARKAP